MPLVAVSVNKEEMFIKLTVPLRKPESASKFDCDYTHSKFCTMSRSEL